VVWTWVAFEQDSREGKERPVLVLAIDGSRITALPLRTKVEHAGQRRAQRRQVWMDLGAGDWDQQGRMSEVQLDRVLTVSIYDVRRTGSELDPDLFADVLAAVRRYR
jgi:hypothetical protein